MALATRLKPALAAAAALVVAAAAGAGSGPVASARWDDVEALVTYETRQVMASGVTRSETWQERLVRRGDQVWAERILARTPHRPDADHAAEPAGHKHLNAETSAHWLSLAADGSVRLRLVDHVHRQVVEIPRAEFGSVAFDGRFDAAAAIVPPAVVRTMQSEGRAGGDAEWRGQRADGWTHRVLWSARHQLAIRVESRRDDGSVERKVTVRLQPGPATRPAPWQSLAGYAARNYDEFMD